jgi:hypothetical protein
MSFQLERPELLILLPFPALSIFLTVLYTRVTDGKFLSVVPTTILTTFLQAGVIVTTTILVKSKDQLTAGSSAPPLSITILNASVILIIFISVSLIVSEVVLYVILTQKTEAHVRSEWERIKIRQECSSCLDKELLKKICIELIELDIRPGILSGQKKDRRKLVAELINSVGTIDQRPVVDTQQMDKSWRHRLGNLAGAFGQMLRRPPAASQAAIAQQEGADVSPTQPNSLPDQHTTHNYSPDMLLLPDRHRWSGAYNGLGLAAFVFFMLMLAAYLFSL